MADRQNAETLAASDLLAAAAIVAAEADERGIPHWTTIADRLAAEAARLSMIRDEVGRYLDEGESTQEGA